MTKILRISEGHKVTPVKAINRFNSRFAYRIDGFKGLYTLEGFDVGNKKFIYKKYNLRRKR